MYAYTHVQLVQLYPDPVGQSLATSRRAAQRFAQLEALQARPDRPAPAARPPLVRRLLALGRLPA